jgi:hypothetical protein
MMAMSFVFAALGGFLLLHGNHSFIVWFCILFFCIGVSPSQSFRRINTI